MFRAWVPLLLSTFAFAQAGLHPGNQAYDSKDLNFKGRCADVMYRDLDADGLADIVITHVATQGNTSTRFLSIWFQRPDVGFGSDPDQTIQLPREAAALAIGRYTADKGEQILYFTSDGVWYLALAPEGLKYDLAAKRLLFLPTFFDEVQDDSIQWWSYAQDIDGDGTADLLVPTPDAYKVFFQTAPGVYGKVLTLRPKGERGADRDIAGPKKGYLTFRKALPRFAIEDFDGDGSSDLICQQEGKLQFFLQDLDHELPKEPTGEFDLSFWKMEKKQNTIERYDMMFANLSGNGSLDMVVSYTEGTIGLFESISTRILVYMGQFGAPYLAAPQQQIHIRGISMSPSLTDVNGDGHPDLVVSSFRTDLMQGLRKGLFGNYTITYYVYFWNPKKGKFNDEPDVSQDIVVDSKLVERGARRPLVRFDGDFDGDGRKDLMMLEEGEKDESKLVVRKGQEKHGFAARDYEIDEYILRMVKTPGGVDLIDLNGDGKCDYVLRYNNHLEVNLSRK